MYQCVRSFPKYFGNRGLVVLISFEPALFALGDTQATNKDQNVSENQSEVDDTTTRTGKKAGEKKKYRVLIILLLPLYMFILCACAGGTRTSIDTSSSLQLHDQL